MNLAGLLEVLDGVVDSPGRIVIMTTNHPEKLDPALVRPGRVNFSLELGHMKCDALVTLVQHIMQEELTPEQHVLAAEIAERKCLTPAMVEQSCAENKSLDTLLENLDAISHCSSPDASSSAGKKQPHEPQSPSSL